jgi:hypothetical protein
MESSLDAGGLPYPREQLAAGIGLVPDHEAHAAHGASVAAVDTAFLLGLGEELVVLDIFLIRIQLTFQEGRRGNARIRITHRLTLSFE